jgi:hypothetical protein
LLRTEGLRPGLPEWSDQEWGRIRTEVRPHDIEVVTRLRKLILDELQRRNYAQNTVRSYIKRAYPDRAASPYLLVAHM